MTVNILIHSPEQCTNVKMQWKSFLWRRQIVESVHVFIGTSLSNGKRGTFGIGMNVFAASIAIAARP